jgi:hypothetical protein
MKQSVHFKKPRTPVNQGRGAMKERQGAMENNHRWLSAPP